MVKMCIPRQNIWIKNSRTSTLIQSWWFIKNNPVCLFATLIHPCSLENSFQFRTLVLKLPVNGYFKMRLHKVFDPFVHVASRCAFLAERKEKFSALSFKLDSCSSSSNKQQSFFSLSLKANSLSCLIRHSFQHKYCKLEGIQPNQ